MVKWDKRSTFLRELIDVMRIEEHYCRFFARRKSVGESYQAGTEIGFSSPRLAFLRKGNCLVETSDGTVSRLSQGDVWFIPKGKPYVSRWYTQEGEISYVMIEFEMDFLSLYYKTMQVISIPEAQLLFEDLWKAWEGESSLESLSAFYRLMDRILPSLEKSKNRSADRVLPALRYLRESHTAPVRVEDLASLCFMSPSRFFEVFREAVGESPICYRNKLKLSRAEVLLSEGKTNEEVCELLNFSSPTFLRRMLKKHLGVTPSEIKKGIRL